MGQQYDRTILHLNNMTIKCSAVFLVLCGAVSLASKLPPGVVRCDRKQADLDDCLVKAVQGAVLLTVEPLPQVGLPRFEPFEVPSMTIGAGTGAVSVQQNYKNVVVHGFTDAKFQHVKFDFEKKEIKLNVLLNKITMKADYDLNGKVLLLPIVGTGPSTLTMGREQKSMERFSPVRRGSEGSASGSRTLSPSTPQQECQRLQRGLQARSSPPRSIPGSPIHQQLVSDQGQMRHQMAECPSPIHQFYPTDPARDPTLGLPPEQFQAAAAAAAGYDPNRSFGSSPLHTSPYATAPSSNLNSPIQQNIYGQVVPGLGMYSGSTSPILNPLLSPSTSPVFGGYAQPTTGPNSISSITQGISGLNTTGAGSITQGTPSTSLQLEIRNQQQLQEDKMDTSGFVSAASTAASAAAGAPPPGAYQPNFLHQTHHIHHILNIHNHRSLTNSPISNPGSPGLDMIQEELPPHMHASAGAVPKMPSQDQQAAVGHPQISVTDVLGSEVTLVAGSDTSEDSMDSLDNQKIAKIPSFIISEPSENLPSITKGIGRKTSQESCGGGDEATSRFFGAASGQVQKAPGEQGQPLQDHPDEFFLRRNSDKSSIYSDDSLSNDSLSIGNQSPSSSSNNTQSSHACDIDIRTRPIDNAYYDRMQISQELSHAGGTENFQIFQGLKDYSPLHDASLPLSDSNENNACGYFQVPDTNLHKNSGSFEFELSEVCSKLQSTDILEMVRRTINDQIPPKTCSSSEDVSDRLSLEYEGGIQIELKIIDKQKDSKGLKMRRISGDHLVYNQLCQQLISCMTVS